MAKNIPRRSAGNGHRAVLKVPQLTVPDGELSSPDAPIGAGGTKSKSYKVLFMYFFSIFIASYRLPGRVGCFATFLIIKRWPFVSVVALFH